MIVVLDMQFLRHGLTAVDVVSDSNFFLLAFCFIFNGNDTTRAALRLELASAIERGDSILNGIADASPKDGMPFD